MGKESGVNWTDASHGFWYGCRKVSPGCLNCYAETKMNRFKQGFDKCTRAKGFNNPLKWKDPKKVFVCPESDFFIEDADDWRPEAWDIIRKTPHLTYQILTKRPENIAARLPADWPYPNVWLGVTAENQAMAELRIPVLLAIDSVTVRFISMEPMLEDINILPFLGAVSGCTVQCLHSKNSCRCQHGDCYEGQQLYKGLDLVIVGGESGPHARPIEEKWIINIKNQCERSGVAFFMKQMSGRKKALREAIPDYLMVRQFPQTRG